MNNPDKFFDREQSFLLHQNLFKKKVMMHIFTELGQHYTIPEQKEIVLQMAMVTFLAEPSEVIVIDGVEVYKSQYEMMKLILAVHVIDDLFDNYELFESESAKIYEYIFNLRDKDFQIQDLYSQIVDCVRALSAKELVHIKSDINYKNLNPILLELERVEESLASSPYKLGLFKIGFVNMVLAGLILNLEKFTTDHYQNENGIHVSGSELKKNLHTVLESLYRETMNLPLVSYELVKWYRTECPLEVLITEASAILQIFLVLGIEDIDMDLVAPLNSILGGCVNLVNGNLDRVNYNTVFHPKNLSELHKVDLYAKQLDICFNLVIERITSNKRDGIMLSEDSLEMKSLLIIAFVYLLLWNGDIMAFKSMPTMIGDMFHEKFKNFFDEEIPKHMRGSLFMANLASIRIILNEVFLINGSKSH